MYPMTSVPDRLRSGSVIGPGRPPDPDGLYLAGPGRSYLLDNPHFRPTPDGNSLDVPGGDNGSFPAFFHRELPDGFH
jgi:hypothetical protein